MGVINNLLGRLKLYADPSVTTQTTTVVQSNTTNSNLALVPNGTGAIVASIPDGAATGGNARGRNAVDLQIVRTDSIYVARGQSDVIAGGQDNRTSNSSFQTIGGGYLNYVNGQIGTIAGGILNTINNGRSFIGGGDTNTVSSDYGVVSGGKSNTASTNSHATVVGGYNNTASGQYSIAGGNSNTASGTNAVVLGQRGIASGYGAFVFQSFNETSTASGNYSIIMGAGANSVTQEGGFCVGYNNSVTSTYATAIGAFCGAYLRGQFVINNNFRFGTLNSSSQISNLTAARESALSTGTTMIISLDGTGTTNLIIPYGTNRAWNVQINWVAVVTAITGTATGVTVGDTITQVQTLGFKKVGGTSSLVGTANTLSTNSDTSMSTASMAYAAGASQELALTFTAPTFTGGGTVTCRVVARVQLTEVAY